MHGVKFGPKLLNPSYISFPLILLVGGWRLAVGIVDRFSWIVYRSTIIDTRYTKALSAYAKASADKGVRR